MQNTVLGFDEAHWLAAQTITGVLGLVGLLWYTRETKKIREATVRQAEAARRPYLRVIDPGPNAGLHAPALFMNQGTGPALNVRAAYLDENLLKHAHDNGSAGVGEKLYAAFGTQKFLLWHELADRGVRFTYTDTGNKKYWTTIKQTGGSYFSNTGEVE